MAKSHSSGPAVIPESSTAELDINAEVQVLEKMTVDSPAEQWTLLH